jgi:uncharacterized protein (DUF2141 family)
MSLSMMLIAAAAAAAPVKEIPSTPDLGTAEGRCRPNETGPAFMITLAGLKDRKGRMKVEVYPSNDDDFLEDDNKLVAAGKTFRRVEVEVPQTGPATLCVRVPGPGDYTMSILHDRDSNRKFGLSVDGVGFPNDPKLGMSKPKAAKVTTRAGAGLTRITVTMNYRRGLLSFGPLKQN